MRWMRIRRKTWPATDSLPLGPGTERASQIVSVSQDRGQDRSSGSRVWHSLSRRPSPCGDTFAVSQIRDLNSKLPSPASRLSAGCGPPGIGMVPERDPACVPCYKHSVPLTSGPREDGSLPAARWVCSSAEHSRSELVQRTRRQILQLAACAGFDLQLSLQDRYIYIYIYIYMSMWL